MSLRPEYTLRVKEFFIKAQFLSCFYMFLMACLQDKQAHPFITLFLGLGAFFWCSWTLAYMCSVGIDKDRWTEYNRFNKY